LLVAAPWGKACAAAKVRASVQALRRTFVDRLRQEKVDAVVEHAIVGHTDEKMRERYSTERVPEAASAVDQVFRLVEGAK
jgi:integrase